VRTTATAMIDSDHARLQRYVAAWTTRLARDQELVSRVRARLEEATVTSVGEAGEMLVTLGSVVRLRDVESGRLFVLTVFLPSDQEVATTGRLPVCWSGAALLGAREGDEVRWPDGFGNRRVRVEAVLFRPQSAYQPDAAKRYSTRPGFRGEHTPAPGSRYGQPVAGAAVGSGSATLY
jgi:regulator of nucleoside diphosphate kinase